MNRGIPSSVSFQHPDLLIICPSSCIASPGNFKISMTALVHGKVRSFFDATLKSSIKANYETHPKGSVSIKELYASDGIAINVLDPAQDFSLIFFNCQRIGK
jgi:hypothetical protein